MSTRGVIYVHSSPSAVCPHVEWAISGVLDARVVLDWTAQEAAPGSARAEVSWAGPVGTAARVATALRAWGMVRFEVTEDPSPGTDGERFSHVPGLGLWHGRTSANGDIVLGEDQVRAALAGATTRESLTRRMDDLLGTRWDDALEEFRFAGEGVAPARLHQVG
ncbi:uncharacterized protein DUF3145 [Actinomycetospora succinea]|uniref:Uncharacterized protein DUF3145 n=1 Tax=Actinomycetospora succinea TaxID=663603 RepID=A0A4R6UUQ7_9PSEU|nr:DUF3145 domain-containing protein [Actinomycetospora succinea]TDQ50922.1 uncharacterized protein DUF3145 [Actinomycetospora succinea]